MSNVKVIPRFRPMNKREQAENAKACAEFGEDSLGLFVPSQSKPTRFTFDHVYSPESSQADVYKAAAEPLVQDIFNGYNATIFAYGQTGSGKSHTMMGQMKHPTMKGIIPRIVEAIFDGIGDADVNIEFTVKISYVEIYNERIKDLLDENKENLKVREGTNGVWIEDVTELYVGDPETIFDIMQEGDQNRAKAATLMNAESSRSHSVFILTLGQRNSQTGTKKGAKLILVDLAGSEKVLKTGAEGQTLNEAKSINKSLSALGNVINALTDPKKAKHIPYRDSKLTFLLSDSLGGNSKTCLIITCSPASTNAEETLSTLRFGNRAKSIKNKPTINQERSVAEYQRLLRNADTKIQLQDAVISSLQEEVNALRKCLEGVDSAHLPFPVPSSASFPKTPAKRLLSSTADGGDFEERLETLPENAASPPQTPYKSGDGELDESSAEAEVKTGDDVEFSSPVAPTTPRAPLAEDGSSVYPSTPLVGLPFSPSGDSSEGSQGSIAQQTRSLILTNQMLEREIEELKREIATMNATSDDKTRALHNKIREFEQAIETLKSEVAEAQLQVERSGEELKSKDQLIENVYEKFELYRKRVDLQEKEHTIVIAELRNDRKDLDQKIIALRQENDMLRADKMLSDQDRRKKAREERQTVRARMRSSGGEWDGKDEEDGADGFGSDGVRIDPMELKLLKDQKDALILALQRKCDQYMNLQLSIQTYKEHIETLELMVEEASRKVTLHQSASVARIRELQEKLSATEALCKKLYESGMYWRNLRTRRGPANPTTAGKAGGEGSAGGGRILVPLQGGGRLSGSVHTQAPHAQSPAPQGDGTEAAVDSSSSSSPSTAAVPTSTSSASSSSTTTSSSSSSALSAQQPSSPTAKVHVPSNAPLQKTGHGMDDFF